MGKTPKSFFTQSGNYLSDSYYSIIGSRLYRFLKKYRFFMITTWAASLFAFLQSKKTAAEILEIKVYAAEQVKENTFLKEKVLTRFANYDNLYEPFWVKIKLNLEFHMIYLNKVYEQKVLTLLGQNRRNYLTKQDKRIHSLEASISYNRNDSIAAHNLGMLISDTEQLIYTIGDSVTVKKKIDIEKWAKIDGIDTLVYGRITKFHNDSLIIYHNKTITTSPADEDKQIGMLLENSLLDDLKRYVKENTKKEKL